MRLERWFERVVRLYPREFRELFADDMLPRGPRAARAARTFLVRRQNALSVLAEALYERLTTREARALPQQRGGPMTSIGHDVRYGARSLVKNPTFTLLAAVTLALGIGVNTTIFSLVNSLLFSKLPITDPDTFGLIQAVSMEANDTESPATLADFALLKEDSNVFVDAAVAVREYFVLTGEGECSGRGAARCRRGRQARSDGRSHGLARSPRRQSDARECSLRDQ